VALSITLAVASTRTFAAVTIVNANNAAPGDDFTNASSSNTTPLTPGAALGSSNWYYNNVRNNGHVGIRTDLPRDGDGSAWMSTTQGPGGLSSKADIEYYLPGGASLGTLGTLSSLSYDWYRSSGGTASAWLHPVLRLFVASPDRTKTGYLVFEREVNRDTFGPFPTPVVAPTNAWQTDDIAGGNYRLWSTGSLPNTALYYTALTLSDWQTNYGSYDVLGISSGVGSGWGTFSGAVDNITIAFGGPEVTYNFEVASVAVPEPASLVAWSLLGIAGLGYCRLRRRSAG
jgi:hypothetical protein